MVRVSAGSCDQRGRPDPYPMGRAVLHARRGSGWYGSSVGAYAAPSQNRAWKVTGFFNVGVDGGGPGLGGAFRHVPSGPVVCVVARRMGGGSLIY